ncbi:MAG TPA: phage baseplate assembly protein V [Acidimicrobiales bacterium]|nr:phage baseplate assembly protein V [Acidimicrobiales bacterium]
MPPLATDTTATVRPHVSLEPLGLPLPPAVEPKLVRVVVDTHLHLPDMFELTFLDEEGTVVAEAGLGIGTEVAVHAGAAGSSSTEKLIAGEVTAIEAVCEELVIHTVVRGYEKAHRLQRARRTRTYVDMTDSDVAEKVARDAGLSVGTVDSTSASHTHLSQVAQTDWEFLRQRAREIGYEVGVAQGEFFFRKASGNTSMGGGLVGAAAGAAAGAAGVGPPTLTFKENLISFRPRLSAACLTPEVEVRVWDPKAAEVVVGSHGAETGTAELEDDPKDLADQFGSGFLGLPIPIPPVPGLPNLGPQPSTKAFVVANRPLGWGATTSAVADQVALGVAEHVASTFAEAEGYAVGDPAIQASKKVDVKGVPKPFEGKWVVTNARHVFDDEEGGYHTQFFVSGRHERSLLGLASGGATDDGRSTIDGMVSGIVTNNNDPDEMGRVKVAFPWLAPDYESDWARVCQFGAGESYGAVFVPDVGDEVLVSFEFGDVRRPYVLGGLINGKSSVDLGGPPVKATGPVSRVVKSGFVSRAGHRLVFDDDGHPTGKLSAITLGTKGDNLALKIDQTNGTVTLSCKPAPPESVKPTGTVTIETGKAGTIDIKTGEGGTVNIDGGASLSLKAQASVKIESQGVVEIKGQLVKLN